MFVAKKVKVTENINNVLQSVENTVGKRENAGYQHFLLFPVFSKVNVVLYRVTINLL